jgi:hypothetical protein
MRKNRWPLSLLGGSQEKNMWENKLKKVLNVGIDEDFGLYVREGDL